MNWHQMDTSERNLVLATIWKALSAREIATILGCSRTTIRHWRMSHNREIQETIPDPVALAQLPINNNRWLSVVGTLSLDAFIAIAHRLLTAEQADKLDRRVKKDKWVFDVMHGLYCRMIGLGE